MNLVNFTANIIAKLESIETALVLFVILFTATVPVCQYVGVDDLLIWIIFLCALVNWMGVVLIIVYRFKKSNNQAIGFLNAALVLEDNLVKIRNKPESNGRKEIEVLRDLVRAYESCYFQSLTQGTSPFQPALRIKIKELKADIKKLNDENESTFK